MAQHPARTTANTAAEHAADHETIRTLHNSWEAAALAATTGQAIRKAAAAGWEVYTPGTGDALLSSDQTFAGLITFGANRIKIGTVLLIKGTGSPEGVEVAPVGSWFFRSDGGTGTSAYRKEAGAEATGWVADGTAGAHPDVNAHDALGLAKQSELDALDAAVVKLAGAQTITGAKTFGETVTFSDGANIAGGATDGIRLATAPDQKLGFFGATPVVQPGVNADTSGAALAALETEVNELKALLRTLGLLASSAPPAGGNKGYLGGYVVGY